MKSIVNKFAMLDPAHVLDGLFTPTAQKGQALYDVCGDFAGGTISFKGVQLSATHQSILLAIASRTGRQSKADGVLVTGQGDALMTQQRALIAAEGCAADQDISVVETSAYSLLQDAGMTLGAKGYERLKTLLHDMSTVSLYRNIGAAGGTAKLLSFQHRKEHLVVSLNWRLTDAIFGGQNVHVSLVERLSLGDQPAAKILHTWFSAYVRRGSMLMAGKGAEIDTLARHVWGKRPCSDDVLRQRRVRVIDALKRIGGLQGWLVTQIGSHAYVSRPKMIEKATDPTPGEMREVEAQTELAWDALWSA